MTINHFRAETETALGCASRELHPSEDLSELPPLRVAVAGQEYQRWCCHRKTGRPRPAFWTNGPAIHLPCRIDAVFLHRWVIARFSNVACQFSVCTWHTSGCISASGYAIEEVHERLFLMIQKSSLHYLSSFRSIVRTKNQKLPIISKNILNFDRIFLRCLLAPLWLIPFCFA